MVLLNEFLGKPRQRLAIDLHNQAVRSEIGIHPIQRKAFFEVKLAVGVVVKDDLGEQSVDGHHGDLAADLDLVAVHLQDLRPA